VEIMSHANARPDAQNTDLNRIPSATYRFQLSPTLDFIAVRELLDYLQELGITDVYLSPLFRSREESSHGYDVVSHTDVEPTFGSGTSFNRLTADIRARGMGLLLDVVPNHMGINDPGNDWWFDVLENGPMSRYARYFDIDWNRPSESLRDKILIPFLGDYFGSVLERGELQIAYESGQLRLNYGPKHYPLAPMTYPMLLEIVRVKLDQSHVAAEAATELDSIIFELQHLPPKRANGELDSQDRYREQSIAKQRLAALVGRHPIVRSALDAAIAEVNGIPGEPRSFDQLEAILNAQWYRLSYWRVAADEINYRRFFDINDLAAIRVELPEVFEKVHALVRELMADGHVTGLRIDHPDGLYDPEEYFKQLQQLYRSCRPGGEALNDAMLYIVAEKILTGTEDLPKQWAVSGTTGYELMNQVGRTFIDEEGLKSLVEIYEDFIGQRQLPADVTYESKRQILHDAMSSELNMLASRLYRIAQQGRSSRDFTFPSLLRALREIIACFPAYRTYVRSHGWDVDAEDHNRISIAIRLAKRRNPTTARALFDFISSVLLLEFAATLEKERREEWREFALKFQQVTGPATAKGVEDTAFYRYYPLLSLNEVGGEIVPTANSVEEFHRLMQRRQLDWPHSLSASSTHDTKRGEDLRARVHVLSQVPERWRDLLEQWDECVQPHLRDVDGELAPNRAEQYLLVQTLVGTWPLSGPQSADWPEYRNRIRQFMEKALREAKQNTSWSNPASEYEQAVLNFVDDTLDESQSQERIALIDSFVRSIADAGYQNSISQLILKACVPGVPDFYQGTEYWDYSLVDPDNRRPVDFSSRIEQLQVLGQQFASDAKQCVDSLAASWPEPTIKLFMTWRLLGLRQEFPDVFRYGSYTPLEVHGPYRDHVIAFARSHEDCWVVVIVPRMLPVVGWNNVDPVAAGDSAVGWSDTNVHLPAEAGLTFRNALTDRFLWTSDLQNEAMQEMDSITAMHSHEVLESDALDVPIAGAAPSSMTLLKEQTIIRLADVLQPWPFAVLVSGQQISAE
jgi:(1->4)-alpha-D-glucan 1-alpha-D-glucosylmutase